ncbi:MAG: hypothetical protein Q9224_006377, partial [Gallowayella concinna]
NTSNNNPQPQQVQYRQLPSGRNQVQIKNENENVNVTTNSNPNSNPPYRQNAGGYGNNRGRNPFRPGDTNRQSYPAARAYQHDNEGDLIDIGEDQENHIPAPDEMDRYHRYEDSYYQNADWTGNQYANDDPGENVDFQEEDHTQNTVESHFTAPKQSHKCRKCYRNFESKNALHRHLRNGDHITTSDAPTSDPPLGSLVVEPPASHVEEIIRSESSDKPAEGYAFCGYRFVF